MTSNNKNKYEDGYVALISAIIIAGVLMAFVFSISRASFLARFNLLDKNAKENSLQLAEGCANIAVLRLIEDESYAGNETIFIGSENCSVLGIETINDGRLIKARAITKNAYTNIKVGMTVASQEDNPNSTPTPTPPALPALCADTIMMLDRTGSMNAAARSNEQTAAKNLIGLYSAVSPAPKLGVGRFGDNVNGGIEAEVETKGRLTSIYGDDDPGNDTDQDLYHAVESATNTNSGVGTNLKDAIDIAQTELTSSRGTILPNVMILISDGDPNEPTGNPTTLALNAANSAKSAGTEIFTIHFGDDPAGFAGKELLAAMASGQDHFFVSPTSVNLIGLFEIIANKICPNVSGLNFSPASTYFSINTWEEVPNF